MKTGLFNRLNQKLKAFVRQKQERIDAYMAILTAGIILVMILGEMFTSLGVLYDINVYIYYIICGFVLLVVAASTLTILAIILFLIIKIIAFVERKFLKD